MKKIILIAILVLGLGAGAQVSAQSYTPPPGQPTDCGTPPVPGCFQPINVSDKAQVKAGELGFSLANILHFGIGASVKGGNAGKIGYDFLRSLAGDGRTQPYLDLTGAGNNSAGIPRVVKIWDNLIVSRDLVADTVNANQICVGTGAARVCVTNLTGGSNVCGAGSKFDVNTDGVVNSTDGQLVTDCANKVAACTTAIKTKADLDGDGKVDTLDVTLINRQVTSCSSASTPDNSVMTLLAGRKCPAGQVMNGFNTDATLSCVPMTGGTTATTAGDMVCGTTACLAFSDPSCTAPSFGINSSLIDKYGVSGWSVTSSQSCQPALDSNGLPVPTGGKVGKQKICCRIVK